MRFITDLHVHGKFSRAVSQSMTLPTIAEYCKKKGIDIIGTGDFTHPAWSAMMEKELEETADGFAVLKGTTSPLFTYTVELSCIYSAGGKTRRMHILLVAPTLKIVKEINARLAAIGNLKADGRPILGTTAQEIAKIAKEVSSQILVIPAHVWTPWFSLFGSMSGFDSIKDAFGDYADQIHAVETGLSSDPAMNWRLSQLDGIQIVSFSDAHSAQKMGREATVLELEKPTYTALHQALTKPSAKNRIESTIEFFPEEGKYHWDGHRDHEIRWTPAETKKHGGICTVCKRPVTVGVLNRNEVLADRAEGVTPADRPPFVSIVPLDEIIAEAFDVGSKSKKVMAAYDALIATCGNEFDILLHVPLEKLREATDPRIAEGIARVRAKKLHINPGYDGVFGTVKLFDEHEREKSAQPKLL